MRRHAGGALLAVLPVAAVVAACGSGASQTQQSQDPKQAVLSAVQHTTAQSFLADVTETEAVSTAGATPASLQTLNGQSISVTLNIAEQTPHRARVQGQVSALGHTVPIVAIVVGSNTYVSVDNGATFRSGPSVSAESSQVGPGQALEYFNAIGTVRDTGHSTVDGVSVETYQATIDSARIVALLKKSLSSLGASLGSVLDSLRFTGGTLTAAIDSQGRLVSDQGTFDVTMNLGALSSQYASSTLAFHITANAHFHDYGATVSVTPPAVVPAAA